MYGIYRIALAAPELHPADVEFNVAKMLAAYQEAVAAGASVVVYPELAVTGRSCGSLFSQPYLLKLARAGAEKLIAATGETPAVFGMPLVCGDAVFDAMVWARGGEVAARIVRYDPDLGYFSGDVPTEAGWYPAGTVFSCGLTTTVEFFGGLPSAERASLRIFAGAEPRLPGAARQREEFFRAFSRCGRCAAAGVFAGDGESGTDVIYGGDAVCAADGERLTDRVRGCVRLFDVDGEKLAAAGFAGGKGAVAAVELPPLPEAPDFEYLDNPAHPFLPSDPAACREFARETLQIQSDALALRRERSGAKTLVLGISGGLDSTLALVVMVKCCRGHGIPASEMVAVTMPGFGTTGRTKSNALRLAELAGATIREISITEACLRHFADLGHDPDRHDSTYENAQARERTQILMDIANQTGGLVVGTGDLSEIALGWCTDNGDHMAMYNVNAAIPKSSIATLLECAAEELPEGAAAILRDIIATPVSPELLPPEADGSIVQKTEQILGAYELHDYFLWQLLNGVSEPAKLLALAKDAFGDKYPEAELVRVRELFFRRFFTQQFKRTAAPDGVQAGPFSLSARGSWVMGADISGKAWRA